MLRKWIDGAAKYEIHWAFRTPQKRALPAAGSSGSDNPVDRWVEAGLAGHDRNLKPRAADEVLARRL